jgi:hypothetical protein
MDLCWKGTKQDEASSKWINMHIKKNRLYKGYNETALAITPDDGPMWPKHVVVEYE